MPLALPPQPQLCPAQSVASSARPRHATISGRAQPPEVCRNYKEIVETHQLTHFDVFKDRIWSWGTWLAQSVQRVTLDLGS